jgi:hypothetical protein
MKSIIPKGSSKMVFGEVIGPTAQSKIPYVEHLWQWDVKVQWNNMKKNVFTPL